MPSADSPSDQSSRRTTDFLQQSFWKIVFSAFGLLLTICGFLVAYTIAQKDWRDDVQDKVHEKLYRDIWEMNAGIRQDYANSFSGMKSEILNQLAVMRTDIDNLRLSLNARIDVSSNDSEKQRAQIFSNLTKQIDSLEKNLQKMVHDIWMELDRHRTQIDAVRGEQQQSKPWITEIKELMKDVKDIEKRISRFETQSSGPKTRP